MGSFRDYGSLSHLHPHALLHASPTLSRGSQSFRMGSTAADKQKPVSTIPHDHQREPLPIATPPKAASVLPSPRPALAPIDPNVPKTYMAATKSAKAKVRSHSQPKQRPRSDFLQDDAPNSNCKKRMSYPVKTASVSPVPKRVLPNSSHDIFQLRREDFSTPSMRFCDRPSARSSELGTGGAYHSVRKPFR